MRPTWFSIAIVQVMEGLSIGLTNVAIHSGLGVIMPMARGCVEAGIVGARRQEFGFPSLGPSLRSVFRLDHSPIRASQERSDLAHLARESIARRKKIRCWFSNRTPTGHCPNLKLSQLGLNMIGKVAASSFVRSICALQPPIPACGMMHLSQIEVCAFDGELT
jgi:hypothetical protein